MEKESLSPEEARLMDALGELPLEALPEARSRQIRFQAYRLLRAGDSALPTRAGWLSNLWNRVLEPSFALGVSVLYLVWGFQSAAALLR